MDALKKESYTEKFIKASGLSVVKPTDALFQMAKSFIDVLHRQKNNNNKQQINGNDYVYLCVNGENWRTRSVEQKETKFEDYLLNNLIGKKDIHIGINTYNDPVRKRKENLKNINACFIDLDSHSVTDFFCDFQEEEAVLLDKINITDLNNHSKELIDKIEYVRSRKHKYIRLSQEEIACVKKLVDCDLFHKKLDSLQRLKDKKPEEITALVKEICAYNNLPRPSILFSGRGVLLLWILNSIENTPEILRRWNTVQHGLWNCFQYIGADTQALDATKCFRLPGSVNSKSLEIVRWIEAPTGDYLVFDALEISIEPFTHQKFELEGLVDEPNSAVIHYTPRSHQEWVYAEELKNNPSLGDLNLVTRSKAQIIKFNGVNVYQMYKCYQQDLNKLWEHIAPGRGALPQGIRNQFSFIYGVAMSYLMHPNDLQAACQEIATRVGLPSYEIRSIHSTLIKKAKETFATKEQKRYRISTAKVIESLRLGGQKIITEKLMIEIDLRILVTDRIRKLRDAEWHIIARFKADYPEIELPEGYQAKLAFIEAYKEHSKTQKKALLDAEKEAKVQTKAEQQARVLELYRQGCSSREISRMTGISKTTILRLIGKCQ